MTNEGRALKAPNLAQLKAMAMSQADQAASKAAALVPLTVARAGAVDKARLALDRATMALSKAKTVKARTKAQARTDRAQLRLDRAEESLANVQDRMAAWEARTDNLRGYWADGDNGPLATQRYHDGAPWHLDLSPFKYGDRDKTGLAPYRGRVRHLDESRQAPVQMLEARTSTDKPYAVGQGLTLVGKTTDLMHPIQGRAKARDNLHRQATRAHQVRQSELVNQGLRVSTQSPWFWFSLGEAYRGTLTRPNGKGKVRALSRSEYDKVYGYPRNQAQAMTTLDNLGLKTARATYQRDGYTVTGGLYNSTQLAYLKVALNRGPFCPHLARARTCDMTEGQHCEGLRTDGACKIGLSHLGPVQGSWEGGYVYQARPREVYGFTDLEALVKTHLKVKVRLQSVAQYQHWNRRIRAHLGLSGGPTRAGLKYREEKVTVATIELALVKGPQAKAKAQDNLDQCEDTLGEYRDELEALVTVARAQDRKAAGKLRRAWRMADKARGEPSVGTEGPTYASGNLDLPTSTPKPSRARRAVHLGPPAPRHRVSRFPGAMQPLDPTPEGYRTLTQPRDHPSCVGAWEHDLTIGTLPVPQSDGRVLLLTQASMGGRSTPLDGLLVTTGAEPVLP